MMTNGRDVAMPEPRSPDRPTVAKTDAEPVVAYEAPSLVEVGSLKSLTAGISFNDPT
jgi:hypothetical protein